MKRRCLLVLDEVFLPQLFGPDELERLRRQVALSQPFSADQLLREPPETLADVELILSSWGMPRLDADLLDLLPRLRAVFYAAGTVKPIVTGEFWARGLRITSAARENARPTAEFAFAEIILSLKRAWPRLFALREARRYQQTDALAPGCFGSTVGLISLGKIGRLVAQRLASLDVHVIAWDPHVSAESASRLGVELVPLPTVFTRAHVVSCHTPLTSETSGFLDGSLFERMRPGATFINTARGGLVREPDLLAVLRARPDLFAVLDVTEQEPPPPDSAWFTLPNVVLTPHIAGSTGPECRRLGRMMVDEMERFLRNEPLLGEVLEDELSTLA